MKTTLFTITMMLVSLAGISQKNEYHQAMGEALGRYATCRTVDDFRALGNSFSMIAGNEREEWLPLYYHAHCFIIMSFMEPSDAVKKDAWLDEAEKSLNRIIPMAAGEADVFALQAMFFTARLVVNPMERGQQYSMLSAQAAGRALGIDPANPRARLIQLQNDMGSARYFGKDVSEYCITAKELLAGWDNFKPASALHPSWGKDQAMEIVSNCK